MNRKRWFMNLQVISFIILKQNETWRLHDHDKGRKLKSEWSLAQPRKKGSEIISYAILYPRENRRLHLTDNERTFFYFLQLANLIRMRTENASVKSLRFRKKVFQFKLFKKITFSTDFQWKSRKFAYYSKYLFGFLALQ